MSFTADAKRRKQKAITDVLDLLGMANCAVHRARAELGGDAFKVASLIAVQLDALRERAEQLARDIENGGAATEKTISLNKPPDES